MIGFITEFVTFFGIVKHENVFNLFLIKVRNFDNENELVKLALIWLEFMFEQFFSSFDDSE